MGNRASTASSTSVTGRSASSRSTRKVGYSSSANSATPWTTTPGKSRRAAARRELVEETGYTGGQWRELCRAELSNSVTDEVTILFVATGLEPGPASPEGTEQLQLRWVPFEETLAMIGRGEITDAMTILALHAVALERARARS